MKLLAKLVELPLEQLVVDAVDDHVLQLAHVLKVQRMHQRPIAQQLRVLSVRRQRYHLQLLHLSRLQLQVEPSRLGVVSVGIIGK